MVMKIIIFWFTCLYACWIGALATRCNQPMRGSLTKSNMEQKATQILIGFMATMFRPENKLVSYESNNWFMLSVVLLASVSKYKQGAIWWLFGFKEVGGSKKMGKCHFSLPYLSKHRKRKMRKPLLLFSFLFYTTIFSLSGYYS